MDIREPPPYLFRPQRGTLAEAMSEVREFDGTWAGLQALLPAGEHLQAVELYHPHDERIGWRTFLVTTWHQLADGTRVPSSPAGFTNGDVYRTDVLTD